jgi:hypothetical protein
MKNFNKKLNCLGISVKEPTGDMQHTKSEILQTQTMSLYEKLHQPELHPLYSPSKITGVINEGGRNGHEHIGNMENTTY